MSSPLSRAALAVVAALAITVSACSSSADDASTATATFAVSSMPEDLSPLSPAFAKHVDVWGVDIVGTETTADEKLLHAANVLAQYLDNDADGEVDDPAVLQAMIGNGAILIMAATPDEFEALPGLDAVFEFVGHGGQDLYGSETDPDTGFDASLEEVHHLILNTGWSRVYPAELGQEAGSGIADAMDIARGGRFETIPEPYPESAWYTYDDQTCDYRCMITEYTYWAHTSLLGAQAGRPDIGQEWRLDDPDRMRAGDPAATSILTDPTLSLPTVLPDGSYGG